MNQSLWQQRWPTGETVETGTVIVGAGITGLSAAMECEARGEPCVVLEAEYPGSKASGRNAGYLMRGAAENYAAASDALGRERARFLWGWTEANLGMLRSIGVEAPPSYEACPSCLVATGDGELEQLERSIGMLREDGFAVERVEAGDVDDAVWRSGHARVGLVNPGDATCSPAELVGLLSDRVERTPVVCNAPVYAIEVGDGGVRVCARGIVVRCQRVLVCTNAYAGRLLSGLGGLVKPNRGQMLALRPEEGGLGRLAYAYYLNHGSEYIRSGPDGTVVIGGCRTVDEAGERTDHEGVTDVIQEALEGWVRRLITDRYEVVARWSGIMGFSGDGMPIICETELGGRVWFCGGLTGHGMSMGHVTARRAVGVMLGAEDNPFGVGADGQRVG